MLSGTHRIFGEAVANSLIATTSFPIDAPALVAGCVWPDFSWASWQYPHTKDQSFAFIVGVLEKLVLREIPQTPGEASDYAGQLGLVLHYIADYFCRAHNDTRLHPLLAHFAYEYTLHEEALQSELAEKMMRYATMAEAYRLSSVAELARAVLRLHALYLSRPPAKAVDIEFALRASSLVAHCAVGLTITANSTTTAA